MDQEKLVNNILWLQAMVELEKNKRKFNSDEIFIINNCIENNETKILDTMRQQIYRDIEKYPKYECICLWTREKGLIDHVPEFIINLVEQFGIRE